MTEKKVVHYLPNEMQVITKGISALILPLDHPSPLVSNTKYVRTTKVLNYDPETGEFETLNTIYKPKHDTHSECSGKEKQTQASVRCSCC